MSLMRGCGFWAALLRFVFAPLCIGGGSKSTSKQEYITTDSRVAGGNAPTAGAGALLAVGGGGVSKTEVTASGTGPVNITETSGQNFARLLDSLDRQNALQGQTLNGLLHSVEGISDLKGAGVQAGMPGLDNKTISLLAVAGVVVAAIAFKFAH